MNFKRRRPKHQRGGCLLCKPWKDEREAKNKPLSAYGGFNGARRLLATTADLRNWQVDYDGTAYLEQEAEACGGCVECVLGWAALHDEHIEVAGVLKASLGEVLRAS